MAEEIIYDQVDGGGDPDPLGLRRQLKQVKKPTQAADPLGLRSQMRTANVQQPAFQVQVAQPTFRATQQTSELRPTGPSEPISIKKEEIGYIPDNRTIEVEKMRGKAQEAHKKIRDELLLNDDQYEKKLRELRRDNYTADDLIQEYKANGWPLPIQSEMPKLLQRAKQRQYEKPITPEDISDIKTGTVLDEKNARSFLKTLNKAEANANSFVIDKFNEISNDPDALERIPKIKNIEKEIKAGRVVYDPEKGQAFKPVGVIGSAIEAVKQKNQLYADRDFLKNTENDAAILSEYKARKKDQLDEPIPVPKGKLSEIIGGMAGTPWQIYAAGALGSLGGPQAGIAAATIVGGREMSKLEYPATFWRTMDELISQGVPEFESVHKARQQADQAAEVGAITGGAMGLVGARMGAAALPKVNLSQGFRQAAFNVLKQNGYELGKAGLEGLATGGVGVAGEIYKNKLAQSAGIKRDIDEGTKQVFEQNLLTTVALAGAIKLFKGVAPKNARQLMHGLSKLPDEQIGEMLSERVQSGDITQKAADDTQQRINEYRGLDKLIPEDVSEEARFKIQDKIKKRNDLDATLETTDKAYHTEIKEKIKALDEEIVSLTKENKQPVEKIPSGLSKEQEKEAIEVANEWIQEGILPPLYEGMVKQDPIGFWKMIAQQAQNMDENWRPLGNEINEQAIRDQFGDTVVDYAKELFPAPQTEVPKSVSVIQPGQINSPEIIGNDNIYIGDLIDKDVSYKGQKGTLYQDGQTVIFKVKGANREYEIGNIEEVKNSPINKYGIEHEASVVSINNDGEIVIRGNSYKNNYSDPFMAINRDADGNVISVSLETKDGQKRTFRGNIAEDIAYNIHLKEINKNNATKSEFEEFINSNEPTRKQVENGRLSEIDQEGAIKNNAEVQRSKIEPETIKPKEDAIQKRSAAPIIVDEATGHSQEVVGGIPESGEVAIPQEEGQRPPQEEGITPGEEGRVGEPSMTGITHRQMDILAEELGLPTYEKSPERVSEWDQQAAKKLQQPEALDNLFTKLRNGELPDHVETRMMLQYMGDIMAKIERDPYNRALQDQLLRTKDLFNIAGRLQGKGLAARKGQIPVEETLPDFIIRDREVNKAPLTDEQIAKSKEEFEEIKKAKDDYEQKVAKLEAENARLKAEKIIKEQAKKTTKQTKDYSSERKQIVSDIRTKLRKARGETSIVAVPYAKELIAIAPDVVKLAKTYIDQGVAELPELVKSIKDALAEDMPHLTEVDVHNIIAGEYNEKKPTRSQLAQQLYDLRREAKLINELDDLQNGKTPVAKDKQLQRNRKIEDLKGQIKELRDELGITNVNKLSALKSRYKKQIADIENKIASKDYGPDVKPEPLKLDEEAIELKDKMIKAKAEREARLAQMEYEQMSGSKRALDLANQSLDAVRTIQTNPDLSFFGRQGIKYFMTHPVQGPKLFWESVKQAFSQSRYDRWLYDIHNSKAWKLIEETGLAVLDPNTLHAAQREEQWRSQLIHKIPGAGQLAKASERAFTSAANMARVDWFMEGVSILEKQGKTWENSANEYKAWASAVNNMTGRGGLGKFEPVVGQLAIPFWSPRLIASNVNLFLNPVYYAKMPKTSRLMLIKNMAQYVGTGLAFLGLAKTLGADVELDPRSSDFGKIKVGNTRYDVWGGASQYIRVLTQIFKGQRKTGNEISELNTRSKVMTGANLIRTKLSPIIGFGVDAFLGENVVGEKVEWKDAYRLLIPMLYNDIKDAAKDGKGGPETAAIAGLLSFLGIGAQTYGGKKDSGASTTRSVNRSQTRTKSKKIKRI